MKGYIMDDIFKLLFDPSKLGYALQDTDGYLRIIIGNQLDPRFFRGQNKDCPLIPSFQRPKLLNDNVKHCVKYIKREEFKENFKLTPYFEILSKVEVLGSYFKFDLDAIAQHYGFATNYLDTTTDEQVAKFFAYTYYDKATRQYYPIQDFTNYQPTLYITSTFHFEKLHPLAIVGFQAVLRPKQQKAMAIDASSENCISSYFSRIPLETNPKIAREIYEYFNGGKDLFPENELINVIECKIKQKLELSKELFLEYCDKFCKDKERLAKQLANNNYKIIDIKPHIDKKLAAKMQRETKNKIIPWIEKNIAFHKIAFDN